MKADDGSTSEGEVVQMEAVRGNGEAEGGKEEPEGGKAEEAFGEDNVRRGGKRIPKGGTRKNNNKRKASSELDECNSSQGDDNSDTELESILPFAVQIQYFTTLLCVYCFFHLCFL